MLDESKIKEVHPGEAVFSSSRYQILFRYPGSLTLSSCGFKPGVDRSDGKTGASRTDKLLGSLMPGASL